MEEKSVGSGENTLRQSFSAHLCQIVDGGSGRLLIGREGTSCLSWTC